VGDVQNVLDLVVGEGFPGNQLVTGIVLDQQNVDRPAVARHGHVHTFPTYT